MSAQRRDYRRAEQAAIDAGRQIEKIVAKSHPTDADRDEVMRLTGKQQALEAQAAQEKADEMNELKQIVAHGHVVGDGVYGSPGDDSETRGFLNYMKSGDTSAIQNLGIDTTGTGALIVPESLHAPIAEAARKLNPILAGAFQWDLRGGDVSGELPIKTAGAAGHATELASRVETAAAAFTNRTMTCHEIYADNRVSTQWLDSVPNAVDLVTRWAIEDLYDVFENDCAVGAGTDRANGLFAATGVFTTVFSGAAATLLNTTPYKLVAALGAKYQPNSTWLCSQATLAVLSAFSLPSNTNVPLVDWSTSPPTMYGRPIMIQSSAPDCSAGVYSLALADLSKAYIVAWHRSPGILRDDYTASGTGRVRFFGTMRCDGQPWSPEAAVLCRCGTV